MSEVRWMRVSDADADYRKLYASHKEIVDCILNTHPPTLGATGEDPLQSLDAGGNALVATEVRVAVAQVDGDPQAASPSPCE